MSRSGADRANDRISPSLICRQGPMLATAQSGKPRRKSGDPGRLPASAAACHGVVPTLRRWRTGRLFTGVLLRGSGRARWGGGGGWGWAVSPARRRHMETDMNDFGRRAGGELLQFGLGGLGPIFSELGAVVAATVVLGLAFVILS